jgi:DNA polymerase-3 subunit epsilon
MLFQKNMSYSKIKILSFDTETLGLEDPNNSTNQIIEFAIVPATIIIDDMQVVELGLYDNVYHKFIKCPSFEELSPNLSQWVIDHNEDLIRKAHSDGISDEVFKLDLATYLEEIKLDFFEGGDLLYLGKSMQSLDAPIMTKHLGWDFMNKWGLNRKKVDVQDVARFLIQQGKLPLETASSRALVEYFNIKEDVNHTAIDDSIDMLKIYSKLLTY